MDFYYVNKNAQNNGNHEVHKLGCSHMPAAENRVPLGDFLSCHMAVQEAKQTYPTADGCFYCSNECIHRD